MAAKTMPRIAGSDKALWDAEPESDPEVSVGPIGVAFALVVELVEADVDG